MPAKPTPERKSRSGSYMPDSIRDGKRLVVRCSEELADRARATAKRHGLTLAQLVEAGCDATEGR